MPGLGTRNNVRSARSFAAKLVADCDPKTRKKREAELTTALNNFATMYQKHANSVDGADWHVHFVKVLEDNNSTANANNASNANNVVNAANFNSTAMVNSTANPNNAVNAANVNSTALVPFNASNAVNANNAAMVNSTAMVRGNAANVNNNNNTKRPAEAMHQDGNNGAASNPNKRVMTEDAVATNFKVNTNGAYTARVHKGTTTSGMQAGTVEFLLSGPATVQVHTASAPAGTPAFARPVVPAQAATPATSGANAQAVADGKGSPSARPVPLDMYL